ncbi:MAG TPA: hypothetical protein VM056_04855 [Terriglobales bacterium]|nr:hypothetical protein [Terriglobales bacterium]
MTIQSKSGGSNSVNCAEFDARLADLLDGAMVGSELENFRAHAEACINCGPLFTQAEQGMMWLKALPEVAPPSNLIHNILAVTSMVEAKSAPVLAGGEASASWWRRMSERISPGLAPAISGLMQPRLAMTAAMAFFSISMLLNIAGVSWNDVKNLDLRPSAISTSASLQYHATTAKVVKYYENIRFVYEFETKVRELKKAATTDQPSSEPSQEEKKPEPQGDDSSQNPPKQQNEKYSLEKGEAVMATLDDLARQPRRMNLRGDSANDDLRKS